MKKLFPFFLLFTFILLSPFSAKATHVMGGEITWDCQPNGQYIFTLKIYRDCNGVGFNTNNHSLQVHNYPNPGNISQIPLTFFSVDDITAACEGSPCATLNPSDPDIPGAIEEYVLVSNPVTLNGVPGANGWVFTWTYGDRNAAIDNIQNAQTYGITLRAKMFAYNGQNANNCFDSSPNFFQKPSTIICASKEFTYNHSAFDAELDSLSYEWARPLDGNFCAPPPCIIGGLYQENINPPFIPLDAGSGYSYLSPFPDTNLDSRNVPAVLDPETGEITFTSYNQGEYISVIKVSAWRCGQKIAEVYRELQTVITAGCAPNEPPQVVTSFSSNILRDTVKVGDFVDFGISILDSLRAGNPKNDSLYIFASGLMFGNNFTDSTGGCPNPPCATLSYPTPDTGFKIYNTRFRWRTSCDHIANYTPVCNVDKNTYLFTIRAFDDYCPAAGQTITSIAVTILADSLVISPDIYCADVQANGDVNLSWEQSPDPDSSFHQWMIYAAASRAGPYNLIDSIANFNQNTYTHNGAGADQQSMHYVVRAKSACNDGWSILETDTISTIYQQISFNNSCVELNWNPMNNPWPNGSDTVYNIYREYPIGSGFNFYATSNTENYCDTLNVCTDTVTYRIELVNVDQSCSSNSNIQGIRFAYPDPPADAGTDQFICQQQSFTLGGSPTSNPGASYQWAPSIGLNDDTLANPIASPADTITYYVSVTDQRGCTEIDSITINTRERPTANAGADSNVCLQSFPFQLYGAVSVSNNGRWIGGNGNFTPNRNNLNANYQPTTAEINNGFVDLQLVSDNIGICDPDTDAVRLNIVRFTGNPIATLNDISCFGANDGSINLNPGGGFTPYSFVWSDGPSIQNRTGLGAGAYTVTISNSFGCDSILSFTLTEPAQLTASITSSNNVSCNGFNDGSATISPAGGTTPYTFLWSDPASTTTATVNNLASGFYQVTVTDNNGCSLVNSTLTISEPTPLVANGVLIQNVSCSGGSDGAALANASGGVSPFTYQWNDAGNTNGSVLNGVSAGNYQFTLMDANGCTDTASVQITEPTQLVSSIGSSSSATCNGFSDGNASVNVNGGTPPYNYQWNDPANSTSDSISNLAAGTYTATITDNLGCSTTETISISEPAVLTSSLAGSRDISCNGFSDGEAYIQANGGTTPYTYLWDDPANTADDTLRNVFAGTYRVTVSDSNGCSTIDSVVINEPNILNVIIDDSANVSCFGLSDGRASANISGGTPPYNIQWNDPASTTVDSIQNLAAGTYLVIVVDAQSCVATDSVMIEQPDTLNATITSSTNLSCFNANDGNTSVNIQGGTSPYIIQWNDPANSTTDSISSLAAGTYVVTVSDQNACADTASIVITQPAVLSLSTQLLDSVSCFGLADGTARASASGGTLPYTFQWNDPLNSTQDTLRNLFAGRYRLTLSDANGCTEIDSVDVGQPDSLNVSLLRADSVSCFGAADGKVLTISQGGTPPYSYLWNNSFTTDSLRAIGAGNYQLTITDAKGCTDFLTVSIGAPSQLVSSIDSSNMVSCNGGADGFARINAIGGTPPYNYQWDDPANSTNQEINSLSSGIYNVTITDANNCITTDRVVISQPASLNFSLSSSTDVSCSGLADGRADLQINGGTTPYTYLWSNTADSSSILNLSAGTYTVTITDSNSCQLIDSVVINEPNPLNTTLTADSINCYGFNDGIIRSQTSGGSGAYTYNWSNNQTAQDIFNLSEGSYIMTVSDANGCTLIDSALIIEPDSISLNLTADDTICVNAAKLLEVNASGGTGTLQYQWNPNLGNLPIQSVSPTSTTTYTVSVTDVNNCPTKVESVEIAVRNIANETVELISSGDICLGDSATLTPQFTPSAGAIGPYSYLWNQGLSGEDPVVVRPTVTTTYVLQIVDACSNSINDSVTVVVSDPPQINLGDSLIQGCSPIVVNFTNQSPASYIHFWDFGNGNISNEDEPSYVFRNPGTYQIGLRVISDQGCESDFNGSYQVEVFPSPESVIQLNSSSANIENPVVSAFADVSDASSYYWTFGDGDSAFVQDPSHTYADTGTYLITLFKINNFGCRDTAYQTFRVEPNFKIEIPNVFIPNQNGSNGGRYDPNNPSNNVFFPFVEYVEKYRLSIFNRWGELIFESKDQMVGWDGYYRGELCQSDVYVYKLEVQFINGQRATKVGDVTLLR